MIRKYAVIAKYHTYWIFTGEKIWAAKREQSAGPESIPKRGLRVTYDKGRYHM